MVRPGALPGSQLTSRLAQRAIGLLAQDGIVAQEVQTRQFEAFMPAALLHSPPASCSVNAFRDAPATAR